MSDGENFFLANLSLVKRIVAFICARHHLNAAEAQDFESIVYVKLVEDDYARLRKFKQQSSLKSFLFTVIRRLFQV